MTKYLPPTKPGFYWAKWKIAAEGTKEGDDLTPSDEWEVVQVNLNCLDPDDPEYLSVAVCGVEKTQWLENFFWGPGPLDPPMVKQTLSFLKTPERG
jgi:hypothetical protein